MQRTRTLLAVALAAAAACGAFAMLLLGQSETASPKRGAADEASHDWSDRGESNAPNRRTKSRRRVDPANASKPRALGDGWYVGDGHEHVVSFDDAPNVNDDPRFRPIGSWTGTDLELHKAMRECFTTSDHMAAPCDFSVNLGLDLIEVEPDPPSANDGSGEHTQITYAGVVVPSDAERGCVQFATCAARAMTGRTLPALDGVPRSAETVHDFKAFPVEGTVAERRARLQSQLADFEAEMNEWRALHPGLDPEDGPQGVRELQAYIDKAAWDLADLE